MNTVIIVCLAAAFALLIERLYPNVRPVKSPFWWPRVVAFNTLQAGIAFLGSVTWDLWLQGNSLLNLSSLSAGHQFVAGYLLITFIYYWWHRARHQLPLLWNWFHQLHHSPKRMEVAMSFYKHPLEIAVNGVLSSALLVSVLGLSPIATAAVITFTGLAELFYHWNVRTPYWLGFIIQRPESHRIHHQRGKHTKNFSDLPVWDWLFGTFENAKNGQVPCGFVDNRELLVGAMLRGKNVNQKEAS